jgi:hypothetical protein
MFAVSYPPYTPIFDMLNPLTRSIYLALYYT